MRRATLMLSVIWIIVLGMQTFAYQYGFFRSQATKGDPWQGTASITREHYDITVHPDYLDVELECEFEVGGTRPQEHADALEIVGNLNLVEGTVVVGLITWWKGDILKGKLKTNDVARAEYEDVVDRHASTIVPPRDPVLLEKRWRDNYDISIYPIEFGSTRKVRIRYLIPAFRRDGDVKAIYPHAFSENATVSIRTADGVSGYALETSEEPVFYDRPITLDNSSFRLRSSGHGNLPVITHVVPQVEESHDGSVMYVGEFSNQNMSGEMAHLVTMSGQEKLLQTSLAQDFVILWRWNYPELLERYAGQIVEQSDLLLRFLDKLESENKRAALIIDKQGGERITFELDSRGGDEFARMVAYLDELKSREVVKPSYTSGDVIYRPEKEIDLQQMKQEFETALKAAMNLFEESKIKLKHLLLLTAGPVRYYDGYTNDSIAFDESIDVDLLSSYVPAEKNRSYHYYYLSDLYWPGVDLMGFVKKHGMLNVMTTIGNGASEFELLTSLQRDDDCHYCAPTTATEAHLYSNLPLDRTITWNIKWGDESIKHLDEIPQVVTQNDGMQYARLLGGSRHLNSIADLMPSSIASTLGFIDHKYSLVALEEDALPEDIARQYEESGVPLLASAEMFPSDDEVYDMPVDEWLAANPPQPIRQATYFYYYPVIMLDARGPLVGMPETAQANNTDSLTSANGPARMTMPQVEEVTLQEEALQPDYNASALSAEKTNHKAIQSTVSLQVKKGSLELDLSNFTAAQQSQITIVLYDLKGRVIARWKLSDFRAQSTLTIPLGRLRLSGGAYLVRIKGVNLNFTKRVFVK